jgi:hypothetical protein
MEPDCQRSIARLKAKQRWLNRFGWAWLVVAFYLFLTRAQMGSDWLALADAACTIAPLTLGSLYSFLVLGGDIHRLEMEELERPARL